MPEATACPPSVVADTIMPSIELEVMITKAAAYEKQTTIFCSPRTPRSSTAQRLRIQKTPPTTAGAHCSTAAHSTNSSMHSELRRARLRLELCRISKSPNDADHQARRCFEIIEQALAGAGAGLRDVVRIRMFLTDPDAAESVSAIHVELFGAIRPATTMVIVAGALDDRRKVEIEAEAELSA